ncbi:MAG: alpha/beta-type small acid-soluble spore protein [Bacillota bacterium]|jgi:hypothetical protein|nr:alpha/beta-type small acid-soluble spore protein [Bacillota bacterium]
MDRKNMVAPEARIALNQMKAEVARELNIANPTVTGRANMTSRQNGYIGGFMSTKRAVELSEQIANQAEAFRHDNSMK